MDYKHPETGKILSQGEMLAIRGRDRAGRLVPRFALYKGIGEPEGTLVDAGRGYTFLRSQEAIAHIERMRRKAEGHRFDPSALLVRPRRGRYEEVIHSSGNGVVS